MTTDTTTALPAWVTATCPDWCTMTHKPDSVWDDASEWHGRDFGDVGGAHVSVLAMIDNTGQTLATEASVNLTTCDTPDDLDEVAGWFRDAAAFMREVQA